MQISKNDAVAFIQALNSIAMYVPPMFFQAVVTSPIAKAALDAANKPDEKPE